LAPNGRAYPTNRVAAVSPWNKGGELRSDFPEALLGMLTNEISNLPKFDGTGLGQIVLVLQGGGTLGAYQVGVYQALREVGAEPDWVIGTSIGAINASIIAGNPVEQRLARLEELWRRITFNSMAEFASGLPLAE
jgi:predicted acylesterase/phospholipase RssA